MVPDLNNANLPGAHLSGANLYGATMAGAELAGVDLSGANLSGANLSGANLTRANLSRAILAGADLFGANLAGGEVTDADLSGANLTGANLHRANLTDADLTDVFLGYTNLASADLTRAHLAGARLIDTILADADLSQTVGLDSLRHMGPSAVDHRTLLRSGKSLPEVFLRGCGLPDRLIDYLPALLDAPIQFYSCFISYSTVNQDFAERLHADLQDKGVRCWFAPHDMQGGKRVHDQIDEAIRHYDRLLLLLSPESMNSSWVGREILKARQKEVTAKRNVLFPVTLCPFEQLRDWELPNADTGEDLARKVREYYVPDFSNWKNHDAYQLAFERLLKALKSAD